ncbi:MAG: type II secretion system protein GspG [Planctomycetota bacterium]
MPQRTFLFLVLASATCFGCGPPRSGEKNLTAQYDARMFCSASQRFQELYDRWPTSLAELVSPPPIDGAPGQRLLKKVRNDPWGRPYLQQVGSQGEPVFVCLGADGEPGGLGAYEDVAWSALTGDLNER